MGACGFSNLYGLCDKKDWLAVKTADLEMLDLQISNRGRKGANVTLIA